MSLPPAETLGSRSPSAIRFLLVADIGLEFAGLDPRHDPFAVCAVPVEILLQGDLLQRRINENGERQRVNQEWERELHAAVSDTQQQRRGPQAAAEEHAAPSAARPPSRTKPEGQSAIASSKVATDSVTAEIAMAAASAARTDGPAAAVVV